MKLNQYFDRSEFACRCKCGMDTVDAELLAVLVDVREHFGVPVTITSGHRCEAHNWSVGGKGGSQHLQSKAADIQVAGKSPGEVADYLESKYQNEYGIGRYKRWCHIDVRRRKARW